MALLSAKGGVSQAVDEHRAWIYLHSINYICARLYTFIYGFLIISQVMPHLFACITFTINVFPGDR